MRGKTPETLPLFSHLEVKGERSRPRHYSQREIVEIGGVYRMGAEGFRIKNLSNDATKLFRWINTVGDREMLEVVARDQGIANLDTALTELKEQGGIEDDPEYPGYVRRIYRRLE